ncbi:YggS family pyridoxal phosphate-dependent enzyme [Synechocystis sp. LKSZ1]|uniref:YggS family pyridoxal phosphate-dependent enzyme n=1 Tax=Synechocystis sp. LKSZ1 TaxID=3144951 RepID=UPI00336BF737
MTSLPSISRIQQAFPPQVRLIAVTKTIAPEIIRLAYEAGIRDFAENRLQEALPKLDALRDLTDITWHFIGHLQANKARKVIEHFPWIHSVDNLPLLQRLERVAQELQHHPQVCLQIKLLPDPDKFGWSPEGLWSNLSAIEACQAVQIRGLMTILPLGLTPSQQQATFASLRDLAAQLSNQSRLQLTELSMGMSGDYPQAIAAGATMVRLGRVLFGERPPTSGQETGSQA